MAMDGGAMWRKSTTVAVRKGHDCGYFGGFSKGSDRVNVWRPGPVGLRGKKKYTGRVLAVHNPLWKVMERAWGRVGDDLKVS